MQTKQREQMVEQQVRAWEVLDALVLDVMQSIPREEFIPQKYKNFASSDVAFKVRPDFQLPSPSVQGKILQALELNDNDAIYQIGAGCGYLTACLALLGGHITACDAGEAELTHLQEKCANLNLTNINTQNLSWTDALQIPEKKYDAIVSQYSYRKIPDSLKKALKINGRAVLFEGSAYLDSCIRIERIGENEWLQENLFETDVSSFPTKSTTSFTF